MMVLCKNESESRQADKVRPILSQYLPDMRMLARRRVLDLSRVSARRADCNPAVLPYRLLPHLPQVQMDTFAFIKRRVRSVK